MPVEHPSISGPPYTVGTLVDALGQYELKLEEANNRLAAIARLTGEATPDREVPLP